MSLLWLDVDDEPGAQSLRGYFLAKDIAEFDRAQESGGNQPST
jgi:hypothetical protein